MNSELAVPHADENRRNAVGCRGMDFFIKLGYPKRLTPPSSQFFARGKRASVAMVLATARRGGALLVIGRRTALLASGAARTSNAVSVLPRQFSSVPPTPPKSRERPEFKEAKLPVDNIEFKETGILTTIDRLSNIMFMAEIFRALWLSAEVCVESFATLRSAVFLDRHFCLMTQQPRSALHDTCTLTLRGRIPQRPRSLVHTNKILQRNVPRLVECFVSCKGLVCESPAASPNLSEERTYARFPSHGASACRNIQRTTISLLCLRWALALLC